MPIKKTQKPAAAPQRKVAPKPRDEETEEGGSSSANSRAAAFDSAKAFGEIDPGKYEAVIVEVVLQDEDDKGQSVRLKIEIATEGDMQGEEAVQFYKIFNADGTTGKGASFLKRDLALLGHEDVSFGDLEQVFEEISDAHTGIVVTVKKNGAYTNVYLQGLCEDTDVIDSYLATRAPFE